MCLSGMSRVTDMGYMFSGALVANPDVRAWDVGQVTDMHEMFSYTELANPDVSQWDVSSVEVIDGMFAQTVSANPDVSQWDVSRCTEMIETFYGAQSANPDVSNWNTSQLTTINFMFYDAALANPDMSEWQLGRLNQAVGAFKNSGLSSENYTALLVNLANQNDLQSGVSLSVGPAYFAEAQSARDALVNNFGWSFIDGGLRIVMEITIVMAFLLSTTAMISMRLLVSHHSTLIVMARAPWGRPITDRAVFWIPVAMVRLMWARRVMMALPLRRAPKPVCLPTIL